MDVTLTAASPLRDIAAFLFTERHAERKLISEDLDMKAICLALIGLAPAILLAGGASAACVENGTDEPLYFTVESRIDELRIGAMLEPGSELCLPEATSAVFTAFASETSVEGCPRLSGSNGRDRLVHFLPTDSCRWASHGE
jgi:hypothetical protein